VIRKTASGYVLKSSDGKRTLGKHDTKAKAEAQERAIKAREAAAKKGSK
jgi:hypothetical protein